jgi:EmrB/QacA subfamily drug resistance transporter
VSETTATGRPADSWDGPVPGAPNRMAVLACVLVGAFMILLDATIVNVAVPTIQRSMHASYSAVEWVVSGYALAYGLLLIPAGRLGDRVGHKKTYLAGLAGFTAASVLCGTSGSAAELIAWRVVQGAMAGVMNPPILAVIQAVFPAKERGRAYGLYGAVAGVATALGPLAGGLLIAWNLHGWGWRPVFLVNLPIGVIGLAAALRLVPESRGRADSIDIPGAVLVSAAMLLITYPLIQGQSSGWPAWAFACLGAAVPLLAAFVLWEWRTIRRGATPLVDIRLFRNRSFSAGTGVSLAYFAGFIGLLFVLSLHLQVGLGWSALHAGLAILPFAAGTFVGGAVSDQVTKRLGRGVLLLGAAVVALSTVAVILIIHSEGPALSGLQLLPALLIGGIGSGLVIAPSVNVVLSGIGWQDAGSASGVLGASQRLGQAVGIAVVGVALFGSLASNAPHAAVRGAPRLEQRLMAAGLSSPAARAGAAHFAACFATQSRALDPSVTPPGCGPGRDPAAAIVFRDAGRQALASNFTHGVQVAALYALGAIILTLLLVLLLPRRPQQPPWPAGEPAGAGEGEPAGEGVWRPGGHQQEPQAEDQRDSRQGRGR